MEATLNPLMLAVIGAPTVAGFWFRVTRWNPRGFRINAIASCVVMAAVALGYGFATFEHPNPFFLANSHLIAATALGVALVAGMLRLIRTTDIEGFLAIPFALIPFWLAAYLCSAYVPASWVMPVAALALFGALGLINAALGTLAVGFSISATLHSLFATESLHYVFLWKDLFELLNVSNGGIKLMIIGTTCLAGSGDILTWLATRLIDGEG